VNEPSGAPVVSFPGGEPLIRTEMPQLEAGIGACKKLVAVTPAGSP
jgi:MoaA/NifB/PqqE/SkfB family radical SAM enzyme